MAKLYDLARMNSATTGTGTLTLGSPITGYLSFVNAGVSNGDVIDYAIYDFGNNGSEIGTRTYSSAGPTVSRTPTKSTNSNAALNLSGNSQVFICPRAETLILPFNQILNTVTSSGTFSLSSVNYGDVLVKVGGAVTVQLPAAASRSGVAASIVDIGGNASNSSANITILPSGSDTIIGSTSLTISVSYGSYTLWPTSTGWYQK